MRGYLGGYSNLERTTDAYLDNNAHVVTLLEAAQAAANASGGAFSVSYAQVRSEREVVGSGKWGGFSAIPAAFLG